MTKSKFAESITGLSQDQLDRIAADVVSEQSRRGVGADEFSRVAQMNDYEFAQFSQRVHDQAKNDRKVRALEAEAAASGKVLADPAAAQESEKHDAAE